MSISSHLEPLAFAALRIVAGLLFMSHGLQKLGVFERPMVDLTSLAGVAALLETIGGPLISVGLFTRPVAFVLAGEMAVAYFRSHQPRGPWPIENGGELSILYCFLFLFITTHGPGRWSIDGAKA